MSGLVSQLSRTLLAATLLGATLGGLGSVGYFFWLNREMCPCAPVGISDSGAGAIAAPMTAAVQQGVVSATVAGALVSLLIAAIFVVPTAVRLRRLTQED